MEAEPLIYVGGAYQLIWALAHGLFPRQLDWKNALATLDDFNRILMLIFSKLLLVFYVGTALICFLHARELVSTALGATVLIFLSLYWFARALLQVQYFGLRSANALNVRLSSGDVSNETVSYVLFGVFLAGVVIFLAPLVLTRL